MKLKKYNQLFESPRHWEDEDDELFGRPNYSSKDEYDYDDYSAGNYEDDEEYEYEEDEESSDDMQHLTYLLRKMFTNSGIDVDVESSGLNIAINVPLTSKETLKSFIKIFDVAKKLKKDILPQYDSSYELWYTKDGQTMIEFSFNYEEDYSNKKTKDEEDNLPW